MATVQTFKSPDALADFMNSIVLPAEFDVLGKRGFFTFVSVSDVVGGGPNGVVAEIAKSEDELQSKLNALSGAADLLLLVAHGGFWLIVSATGATVISAVVTTFKSPDALASGTGLVVVAGLDDDGVLDEYEVGDVVVSYGANYTVIKAVPGGTTILVKGGFYTVIVIS